MVAVALPETERVCAADAYLLLCGAFEVETVDAVERQKVADVLACREAARRAASASGPVGVARQQKAFAGLLQAKQSLAFFRRRAEPLRATANSDTVCPVCLELPLPEQLTLSKCGHYLCVTCHEELRSKAAAASTASGQAWKCPTCRQAQAEPRIQLTGLPSPHPISRKLDPILRQLRDLLSRDESVVVFADGEDILGALKGAAAVWGLSGLSGPSGQRLLRLRPLQSERRAFLELLETHHVFFVHTVSTAVQATALARLRPWPSCAAVTVWHFYAEGTSEEDGLKFPDWLGERQ